MEQSGLRGGMERRLYWSLISEQKYKGSDMLIPAIIFITSALGFYTIAVWWEKSTKALKGRHLLLFWLGLIYDTTGTTLMGKLAGASSS